MLNVSISVQALIYLVLVSACSNDLRPKMSTRQTTTSSPGVSGNATAVPPESEQTASKDPSTDKTDANPAGPANNMPPPTNTSVPAGTGTATGKLTVDFTPVDVPGTYSPRNVLAVFVTDSANKLVKTLFATGGGPRVVHLRRWQQLSNKTIDGFTGATRNTVTPTGALTWDMKNRAGMPVPNGNYKIWFETATSNIPAINPAAPDDGLSGTLNIDSARGYKVLIMPVVVGPTGSNKQETANPTFTKISVVHTP